MQMPQTGLEEINGDLLEPDFCPGITSGLLVIREQSARKEYAGAKQVMMHGWVYPLF